MVQTVKNLLKQAEDPYLAILNYRATLHPWCRLNPAKLCMGRRSRTMVPMTVELLSLKWTYFHNFGKRMLKSRRNKRNIMIVIMVFTYYHQFLIRSTYGSRSCIVEMPTGHIHRNRCDIKVMLPTPEINRPVTLEPSRIMTQSQTGTVIKPPAWYQQS